MSTSLAKAHKIVDRLVVFTSHANRPYVNLPCPRNPAASQATPLRSSAFRNWFFGEYWAECDAIPSTQAFHSVLDQLEGRAFRDPGNTGISVFRRVASDASPDGRPTLAIDLANPTGDCVEITGAGWQVKPLRSLPFEPSFAAVATPAPIPPPGRPLAPLDTLRAALNLDRPGWLRCLAWLLAAFRPTGPYPVLILQGPPASGKSLAARILRTLAEPATAAFAPTPASVRDLVAIARRQHVIALDHVSALSPNVTDALCRLSSGLGVALPEELHSRGAQPAAETYKRPVILTVTDRWTCPADLASRALVVDCPPLPPARHRNEEDICAGISDAYPAIFGVLCSALSAALGNAAELTRPASGNHCSDALAWAIAAAPALDYTAAEMQAAFAAPPPPHPLVDAIRRLLDQRSRWTGTATGLQALLGPDFPCRTPQGVARSLRQNQLVLAGAGIAITFSRLHEGVRTIEVVQTAPAPESAGDDPPEDPAPGSSPSPIPDPQPTDPTPLNPAPDFVPQPGHSSSPGVQPLARQAAPPCAVAPRCPLHSPRRSRRLLRSPSPAMSARHSSRGRVPVRPETRCRERTLVNSSFYGVSHFQ